RLLESRMQHLDHLQKRLVHPGERLRHQRAQLEHLSQRLNRGLQHNLNTQRWQLRQLSDRIGSARPNVAPLIQRHTHLSTRLTLVMQNRLVFAQGEIARLAGNLDHLNPQAILERGYSIVRDEQGNVVRDSGALQVGSEVGLTFAVGAAKAKVVSKST
ncbi:MAG: exodeoxyribonuclease VII large subunit, partial [Burkholderiales bacterium]|nr:exodeoxyribonuclease VII large subunit [Burkholderiales bacterium]